MLWVTAFHIIVVVTWFAALFYLPRLFVYHAMSDDAMGQERFKVMERKLYWGIMTPSAMLTAILGGWLLWDYAWTAYADSLWLTLKLILVAGLFAYHLYCGHCVKQFRDNKNTHSHTFYRWMNEFPVLLLVAIVILVKVKPF
jgi:protoporphyrinogen IX oxidase